MNRFRRLSVALAVAGVLGVAAPAAASAATTTVTISGATASYPLVSLLAQKYVKLFPKKYKFKIAQGGAQIGINDVAAGRVTIGDVSRDPLPTDPRRPRLLPDREVRDLRGDEQSEHALQPHAGAGRRRSSPARRAPGARSPARPPRGTIDLISRTSVAGVLTSFQTLLLEGKKVASLASELSSEGLLRQAVENDPNGIGFLSNYGASLGSVNSVSYNGVACNQTTVASGQYAGIARFYEVTKGKATGAASAFIGWIESSAAARKIISSQWVPITQ